MSQLDIHVCTKSKCTAKRVQVKLQAAAPEPGLYNGPALLDAIRELVEAKSQTAHISVHEVACMAGCPVGPRVDMVCKGQRVMYFNRQRPTGRADLVTWQSVESIEQEINNRLETRALGPD
jgi:predicted metal-binding protein